MGGLASAVSRFWSVVDKTDTCWNWKGTLGGNRRYGNFYVGEHVYMQAHRFSYELNIGPIPYGLCVCHQCDNPRCVRPDHLFVGTMKDNMHDCSRKKRFMHAQRTHCKQGHILVRKGLRRSCPICHRAYGKADYIKNRGKILERSRLRYLMVVKPRQQEAAWEG